MTYEEFRTALYTVRSPEPAMLDFRDTLLEQVSRKDAAATVHPAEYLLVESLTSRDLQKERENVRRIGSGRNRAAGLDAGTYEMMARIVRATFPAEFRDELRAETEAAKEAMGRRA